MTFEKELICDLDKIIDISKIYIEKSNDKYFANLAKIFPVLGSKINWKKVPESIEEDVQSDDFLSQIIFFKKICEKFNLSEECIVIGDSAIDIAMLMSIDVLNLCLMKIIEIPQHLYVVSKDYSWCFSFTMEGNMAFGFSNRSR